MRNITVSVVMTVYHDGQFWVGLAQRNEHGKLSVARIVFGAEPSNEEILEFVIHRWDSLRFTNPIEHDQPKTISNPKRRQREASRELSQRGPSTKSQMALAEQREMAARQRKAAARTKREVAKRERFEQRTAKRKRKHRGK